MHLSTEPTPRVRAFAAATLFGASALEVLAMAHHPTAHGNSGDALVGAVTRIDGQNAIVHAAMIAMLLAVWIALGEYSAWRGARTATRIAGRLYAAGVAAMVGAALVNGFAMEAVATRALAAGGDAVHDAARLFPLAWALNQALAGFGVFALSLGIAAWSTELWRGPGRLARITAGYGVTMAAVVCLAYAAGLFRLDVIGMGAVVAAQGLWYALVGGVLWRGGD